MSTFPTLPLLFLALLIAGTSSASASTEELKSDDVTSYWRAVTNDQPLPAALQDLIPLEADKALEKTTDHIFSGELKKDPNMDYLRYKNNPNMAQPDYLRYKNDPNMVPANYLGYKRDSLLNNVDPEVSVSLQKDQKRVNLDYLRYKKDSRLNNVDLGYLGRYKKYSQVNDVDLGYLGRYRKNSQLGNVDLGYLGRYKKDNRVNNVDLGYLGRYKKDSQLDNVDLGYLGRYKKDRQVNNVDLGYLGRYKKDSQLENVDRVNDIDLGYLGRYKKDSQVNDVDLGYLGRYKKDSQLDNVDLGYLGRYKKDSQVNDVDLGYLGRYKKDSQVNDVDLGYLGRYKKDRQLGNVDLGYLGRYKKDNQVNNVDLGYLGRYKKDGQLNNIDLGYLGRYKKDSQLDNVDLGYLGRYKKDEQLNNVDLSYLGRYKKDSDMNNVNYRDQNAKTSQNDPNEAQLNYLRYKKDSLSNKVEHAKLLVFIPSDLCVGNKFLTIFPNVHSSSSSQFLSPKFLSRNVADSIPFSSAHLPDIMERFGIQPDSSWANSIKETLKSCEAKESMGEALFCATSLESMLDSVRKTIGSNYEINFISTVHLTKPSSNDGPIETPQKYTLLEAAKEIETPKKLNCHPMTYPYPVFGCHSVKNTKVYRLLLEGEDKSKVDAVAVCHMDTSDWKVDALFLLAAGLKPGEGAVCHFMQPSHFSIYASSKGAKGAI